MVELMVVIIIMAILGLAIMPALMGSSEKAKYSRAWSDLDAIANAFTAYYGKEGTLPTLNSTTDLDEKIYADADDERELLQSFLGTQLVDLYDPWNERYQIKSTWNAGTGKGHIVVYVKPVGDDSGEDPGFAGITGITARKDPYGDDLPMAKLIINVM